jgi:hypothetical protein
MTHVDDTTGQRTPAGNGYAGHGQGLNNPGMQNVHDVGPLPQGTYTIGPEHNNPHTGPATMNLTPDPANNMAGRDAFRIHGDNARGDQSASNGCIVLPRNARDNINNGGDNTLVVVPGAPPPPAPPPGGNGARAQQQANAAQNQNQPQPAAGGQAAGAPAAAPAAPAAGQAAPAPPQAAPAAAPAAHGAAPAAPNAPPNPRQPPPPAAPPPPPPPPVHN